MLERRCCCGNTLSLLETCGSDAIVIQRPCRCDFPDGTAIIAKVMEIPDTTARHHYNQRVKLGLPGVMDLERGVAKRWT